MQRYLMREKRLCTSSHFSGRHVWLQVARGNVIVFNGNKLAHGDGLAVSFNESRLIISGDGPAEVLLFDLV